MAEYERAKEKSDEAEADREAAELIEEEGGVPMRPSDMSPDPHDYSNHGGPTAPAKLVATPTADAPKGFPNSQWFSEGNGGESRKSFHGYPNGYAQLIQSPTSWHITPMQIDTRRRDCGVTRASIHNCTKFEPCARVRTRT